VILGVPVSLREMYTAVGNIEEIVIPLTIYCRCLQCHAVQSDITNLTLLLLSIMSSNVAIE
jgi:hypothetical protein